MISGGSQPKYCAPTLGVGQSPNSFRNDHRIRSATTPATITMIFLDVVGGVLGSDSKVAVNADRDSVLEPGHRSVISDPLDDYVKGEARHSSSKISSGKIVRTNMNA